MRHSMKWIALVLIVLVAGLVGSVSAQKGKPTQPVTHWTLEILGADDPTLATVVGGLRSPRRPKCSL